MNLRGKHHKPGGKEKEGKKYSSRREDLCLRRANEEDAIADLAIYLGGNSLTARNRISAVLDFLLSRIKDNQGKFVQPPRSRKIVEANVTVEQLAVYAVSGKGGLSEIGRYFGRTQHMRQKMEQVE